MSRSWLLVSCAIALAGCRSDPRPVPVESSAQGGHFVLSGATVAGVGAADVEIRDGRIVAVGRVSPDARRVDVVGRFIAPAFIDSHVHLAYLPRAEELAAGGVAAAVDLAAPIAFLSADTRPLTVIASGPMITAVGGYPTESWGKHGYGREISGAAQAASAVDELASHGARLIKLPVTDAPALDDSELEAAADRAHARGMKVVVHALADAEAARAARAGADVLAHVPTEPLAEETLEAWRGRAVISTLSAFGGGVAQKNLAALRARGARVLYGTDFGNTSTLGISEREIEQLVAAGLDGRAVLAAGTELPAELWGMSELGAIEPGKRASLLVLESDPLDDPSVLAKPSSVYIDGVLR